MRILDKNTQLYSIVLYLTPEEGKNLADKLELLINKNKNTVDFEDDDEYIKKISINVIND